MQTIELGRGMTSPIKIPESAAMVSATHAAVCIDDNGIWTIEDRGSTNGTWICMPGEHNYRRIYSPMTIDRDTLISLGGDRYTAKTYCLKAIELIDERHPFSSDFKKMQRLAPQAEAKYIKVNKATSLLNRVISPVVTALVSLLLLIPNDKMPSSYLVSRFAFAIASLIIAIITVIFNEFIVGPIKKKRDELFRCPNPRCHRPLTVEEINYGQCSNSKCRASI